MLWGLLPTGLVSVECRRNGVHATVLSLWLFHAH